MIKIKIPKPISPGNAEIADFDDPVFGKKDVLRFQVPVHDVLRMHVLKWMTGMLLNYSRLHYIMFTFTLHLLRTTFAKSYNHKHEWKINPTTTNDTFNNNILSLKQLLVLITYYILNVSE